MHDFTPYFVTEFIEQLKISNLKNEDNTNKYEIKFRGNNFSVYKNYETDKQKEYII